MRQIPVEILEEILSKLHVKDLVRFKSVSKIWNSIISSQHFIQFHLKKSISSSSHRRIFMPYGETLETVGCGKDLQADAKEQPIPDETKGKLFIGTSDGLFCYLHEDTMRIFVWNPSLRLSKSLDLNITTESYATVFFFWFGRESSDDEYKIVMGVDSHDGKGETFKYHTHHINPFSDDCNPKSTQEIDNIRWSSYEQGTLLHGVVHWLGFCLTHDNVGSSLVFSYSLVFTYDLGRKTLGEISMPVRLDFFNGAIGVVDGCFSATYSVLGGDSAIFDLWMMKEYGVKESWTKLTIDISLGCAGDRMWYARRLTLFGVAANGDLILRLFPSCQLFIYKVAENKSEFLMSTGYRFALMYVESLVFP